MRILIATNGSSQSEMALQFAAQLARRAAEPPTVLMVIRPESGCPPLQAEAILARARNFLEPQVSSVRSKVRFGQPATEIIREAAEGGYDLLIVSGTHDRNPLRRLLAGSVALRVVEHAPCPVLVAKGKAEPIRRILLCDSGASVPSAVLSTDRSTGVRPGASVLGRFTAQLAELLEGKEEVTILHVMSQMGAGPGVQGKQLRASVEELITERAPEGRLLEQDIHVLEQSGVYPHPKIRYGLVVDEILREARCGGYDLVIIGAHPEQGWQRILLEDLARKIVVHLDRPVLVVK
jgi:nucleotide-binding universal stress UspA family protein